MTAEAKVEGYGVEGKLVLNFKVPISKLVPCQGQIIPVSRRIKTEKWFVHQDHNGNFTQKKIGV